MEAMGDRIANVSVIEFVFPGTHDSGAFWLSDNLIPSTQPVTVDFIKLASDFGVPVLELIKNWAYAQSLDTYQQLEHGARYIDLRCMFSPKDGVWRTFHGTYGITIKRMLLDVAQFLSNHTEEVVIVDASHFDFFTTADMNDLIGMMKSILGDWLIEKSSPIESLQIGDLQRRNKRCLMIFEDMVPAYENSFLWARHTLWGPYANSPNTTAMLLHNLFLMENFGQYNNLLRVWHTLTEDADTVIAGLIDPDTYPHTLHELTRTCARELESFLQSYSWLLPSNTLVVDWIQESPAVMLAQVFNYVHANCMDDIRFRPRSINGDDCRSWRLHGLCSKNDTIRSLCPLTCGTCPRDEGLPGADCTRTKSCIMGSCVSDLSGNSFTCTAAEAGAPGVPCGSDYMCLSLQCSRTTYQCLGRDSNVVENY